MHNTIDRASGRLRWLHDLSFSIYGSLLFAWLEELRPHAWSGQGRFLYFWRPDTVSLKLSDFLLFYLELFLIAAITIFIILMLIRRFSSLSILRRVGLVLAFAAFPFACLYRYEFGQVWRRFPLVVMWLVATGILLWAYPNKFKTSVRVNIAMLFLYFSLVAYLGGGAGLISDPPREWGIWDYAWIVYPAVGFCYALVWAAYFGRSTIPSS